MAARIVKGPPPWGQYSLAIANPRLSNWAQRMRASAEGRGASPWSAHWSMALTGALGMISARRLAWGASTPWKRIRGHRGRGTSAASRCMNSRGDIPNRGGAVVVRAFELQHDLTGTVEYQPFIGEGRAGDVAAEVLELVALIDGEPHFGVQAKALLIDTALQRGHRRLVGESL